MLLPAGAGDVWLQASQIFKHYANGPGPGRSLNQILFSLLVISENGEFKRKSKWLLETDGSALMKVLREFEFLLSDKFLGLKN